MREPTTREAIGRAIFRLYPLADGCGTVSNIAASEIVLPRRREPVWCDIGGRRALVPIDDLVGRAMFLVGELDRKVGYTMRRRVKPGAVALDVGANLGLTTLQMANLGASRILAFEPNPTVLTYLEQTLDANSDAAIELHRVAVGDREASLPLSAPAGNLGRASLVPTDQRPADVEVIDVPVRPLAAILEEAKVATVDIMKMDVEGFEPQALKGLFDGPVRPRQILFEEHDIVDSETRALLEGEGYALRGLVSSKAFFVEEVDATDPRFLRCHDFVAERG